MSIFCAFASLINTDNKAIKVTPPNIGRKIVMPSPIMAKLHHLNGNVIIGLRLDVHEKSSIATNKYNVDLNFISTLFDIDKLKVIHDISQLKIKLNSPLEADQQTKTICHAVPISSKLQKLRRTDSDSSLLSSNLTSSTSSIDSDDLHNIDPKDPNVLYPPYYLPPPGFIPSTPNSTMSENDDDGTEALAAEPIGWVRLEPRPFLASVGSASVKF
ncbi:unnamed protein product [Rotaria socialis]|uniref:Uncharacterized protein n=1 Tax=Rotaria socialis TaxID=392032 RepID=A0A820XZ81_9BILA|nr:unnamed protein product [Rotaria socialis]